MYQYPYFATEKNNSGSSPADISGLQLWLESNTNVTIATGVSSWVDRASSINYAQVTGASQPTYNATEKNGKGILSFTGSPSQSLTVSNPPLLNNASGFTLFTVIQPLSVPVSNSNAFYISIGTSVGSARLALQLLSTSKIRFFVRRADVDGASSLDSLSNYSISAFQIVCLQYDASSRTGRIFTNNPITADNSNTSTFGSVGTNISATNSQISTVAVNGGSPYNGKHGDILLYNKALNDIERTNVFNYLNNRFNVY
jgi:hypothetical protein